MDEKSIRKKQDIDDYSRELGGVNVARNDRFFVGGENSRNPQARQRKENRQALQTQLDILMQNPVYAAAYRSANSAIDNTQSKLNAAMMSTAANIERLSDLVQDMENRTAKLPDGTAVFNTKDGTLKTSDGRHLGEAETASLLNPENLLDYDAYKTAQGALSGARARQDRYGEIQTEIDEARDQVKEAKTPEELEQIQKDVEAAQDRIQQEQSMSSSFDQAATPSAQDMAHDFKLEFQTASP